MEIFLLASLVQLDTISILFQFARSVLVQAVHPIRLVSVAKWDSTSIVEIVLIVVMFTVNVKVVKVPQFACPVTLLTSFHLPIVLFVL